MAELDERDVVVLGGGAAGIAAATLLTRARRDVVLVDAGHPRNAAAQHLHGFLSRDGETPQRLLDAGRAELAQHGGHLVEARAERAAAEPDGRFRIDLDSGDVLRPRGVLVATGLRDELPDVPGVAQRWGIDVLHCPYCHGYEVRDAPIAVLGGANRGFTLHQAQLVRQWSADVVFFAAGMELTDQERERLTARGIRIDETPVAGIAVQDDQLRGVELVDGEVLPRSAVFVGPRFLPNDALLTELGCGRGADGWVAVGAGWATDVPGVWAAGNVVDSPAQLINAASAGSTAGIAINHHLLAEDVDRAVRDRDSGTAVR